MGTEQTSARGAVTEGNILNTNVVIAIIVMLLSYCINAMDRTVFPLVLSDVRKEFGFSLQDAGLMSTVFTLGMAVAGIPTGYLMSRLSRKSVMQVGIFIYSVATIATVWAQGFPDMLLYRAISGVGEAMQLTALLAILPSYFQNYRGAAVGSLNISYGGGAFLGPAVGAVIWTAYGEWRAPMIWFGVLGLAMMLFIQWLVRPSLSEANTSSTSGAALTIGGAKSLKNHNIFILAILSLLLGFSYFGFLGLYPTFLREQLHYTPQDTGHVMSLYGIGALVSIAAGWLGDRFSPRLILSVSFLLAAIFCALVFEGPTTVGAQAAFTAALGTLFSGMLFVNLVAYSVKSVTGDLAGRASGVFVTCFYATGSAAGYLIGWLASHFGWILAANLQLVGLCIIGAGISLAISPAAMSRPRK